MLEYRSPKGDNDMNNINDKYKLLNSGIEKDKKLRRKILERIFSDKNANVGVYQNVIMMFLQIMKLS